MAQVMTDEIAMQKALVRDEQLFPKAYREEEVRKALVYRGSYRTYLMCTTFLCSSKAGLLA